MEITGKIIELLPAQTGQSARGEWKRQDFIIETQEQYPKKICIGNFNDKVDLGAMGVGTSVIVSVNIESREYNGRWYTSINAWKMATAGSASAAPDMPGDFPPPGDIPPPSEEGGTDDLPF